MDFNQLYSDHQHLLMRAQRASSPALRDAHELAASHLAGRIGCLQRAVGAAAAPAWETLAAPAHSRLASPGRPAPGYVF